MLNDISKNKIFMNSELPKRIFTVNLSCAMVILLRFFQVSKLMVVIAGAVTFLVLVFVACRGC